MTDLEKFQLENAELKATLAKVHRQAIEQQIKLLAAQAEASQWQFKFQIASLDPSMRQAEQLAQSSADQLQATRKTIFGGD